MKRLITILLLTTALLQGKAQDFHLAQYEQAPQYLNPALTGMYYGTDADYRVNMNLRSQWRSVTQKPYNTYSLGFDMPYERFGIGAYFIDNLAGTGGFNTFNFMASGAYRINQRATDEHQMTVGLQMGIMHRSFDPNRHTYNEQYSPTAGGFDQNINNGELFDKNSMVRFDATLGFHYRYLDATKDFNPYGGLSVLHLTKPNESFTSVKQRLPMHFLLHGGTYWFIDEQWTGEATLLTMLTNSKGKWAGKAYEYNFGLRAWYHIEETDYTPMLGLNYRIEDAIVIQTGLKWQKSIFRFSYDINVSPLKSYSRGRGAWEFSALYLFNKGEVIPKRRTLQSFE